MKTIPVPLSQNPYSILVGRDILPKIGSTLKKLKTGCRDAFVITNPVIKRLYGKIVAQSLCKAGFNVKFFEVPDGEKSKSVKPAFDLVGQIAKADLLKQSFIIALGGGVIGDLAGYIASCYKRGIPYVQVPTTLLAQVDSSIGGKVAIDLPVGKNLVGAFYQPKMVFTDVSVLLSLKKRQILNGYAEVVKYGIIYDRKLFDYIEKNIQKLLSLDLKSLEKIVGECSRIKSEVVVADEKETAGIRTILNFGHTVGHALEAAAKYDKYQHGEAVALGMRIATDISFKMALTPQKNVVLINKLLTEMGMPEKVEGVKLTGIMKVMKHDKKFLRGKNRFVLVRSVGKVKVVEGIPEDVIKGSIRRFLV